MSTDDAATTAPADPASTPTSTDFSDVEGLLRLPRLASLAALSGGRVVAAIQEADEHGARTPSALWELDPTGAEPARRLTRSEKGESGPRPGPDGFVLFTSARPDPDGGSFEDKPGIWRLPASGEAELVAAAPGGLELLAVADDGTMLAAFSITLLAIEAIIFYPPVTAIIKILKIRLLPNSEKPIQRPTTTDNKASIK